MCLIGFSSSGSRGEISSLVGLCGVSLNVMAVALAEGRRARARARAYACATAPRARARTRGCYRGSCSRGGTSSMSGSTGNLTRRQPEEATPELDEHGAELKPTRLRTRTARNILQSAPDETETEQETVEPETF
eukprot:COSAG02_NODE_38961_length_422_cov_1.445820_1_plen_133_part_10